MSEYRRIRAISKAFRTESMNTMHGGVHTYDEGHETLLDLVTQKSDKEVIELAKSKAAEKELELYSVYVVGSKATSFGTSATWCESEIYIDETRPLYYEGHFDSKGNRIDMQ